MSDEQTQSNTDVSLLQHTINLFLKEALPYLALDACADAILRSVVRSLPAGNAVASLWRPGQRPNTRYRMALEGGTVTQRESNEPDFLTESAKETSGLDDDLRILLHRSLKSLTSDPPAAEILRAAGCRAAIEIRFCYYGRMILQIICGSRSAKGLITKEAEDFLALFCRCCLISLQGSYIAEMEEKSGRSTRLLFQERPALLLHWFHSVTRHLSLGMARLQSRQFQEAMDALERTWVVAGVCLAEILAFIKAVGERGWESSSVVQEFSGVPEVAGVQKEGVQEVQEFSSSGVQELQEEGRRDSIPATPGS
jgi:hypothetical protein